MGIIGWILIWECAGEIKYCPYLCRKSSRVCGKCAVFRESTAERFGSVRDWGAVRCDMDCACIHYTVYGRNFSYPETPVRQYGGCEIYGSYREMVGYRKEQWLWQPCHYFILWNRKRQCVSFTGGCTKSQRYEAVRYYLWGWKRKEGTESKRNHAGTAKAGVDPGSLQRVDI